MPSSLDALASSVRRPENVSILVAIVLAVPTGLLAETWLHWEGLGFLLVLALGVMVPTAYRRQWPGHRSTAGAPAWTVVACAIAATVTVGLTTLGGTYGGQSEVIAAVVGFLVVALGGPILLYRLTGQASH